jgi:hypothetical protein
MDGITQFKEMLHECLRYEVVGRCVHYRKAL